MDACRRLKRTVDLKLVALHRIDVIADNSGCELGKVLDRLASFADEIDIAVIVTSEMERGRVRIDGRRPLLFHLRNSDSVCQYADTVLIAHRPGLYNDKTDPNETELILAKHIQSHAQTGILKIHRPMTGPRRRGSPGEPKD